MHFFTTDIGSVTSLLNEIMIQRYAFQTLNNILIIALHIGVLAIFCKFWAHFGLINSSRWLSDRIFVWNHGRVISFLKKTYKIVHALKYDENFSRKLPSIGKYMVNLGYWVKFLNKLSFKWIKMLLSTERYFNWVFCHFYFMKKSTLVFELLFY